LPSFHVKSLLAKELLLVRYLKLVRYLTVDNIDEALDIVLRLKDEAARIGIVTHAADVLFRKGGLK
jgi:hypothetical protein